MQYFEGTALFLIPLGFIVRSSLDIIDLFFYRLVFSCIGFNSFSIARKTRGDRNNASKIVFDFPQRCSIS